MKANNDVRPVFCDTCGGPLRYSQDGLEATCPYCGNRYNFRGGKSEALSLALSRANSYRLNCDFDEAIREYTLITERNPDDAEAWWGLALSKYGIEYVPDPRTGMRVPTCHRTVKESILCDESYLNAIKYAAPAQAESYRLKAEQIERLQSGIKSRLAQEESFDVFLCFRSADKNGAPTKERTVARRIYDELTRRGINTFFSEESLKGRLGEDYEPIIYKALYSCRFFILIATSVENVNTAWVKNEWSRFRDRVYEERLSSACCAVFENITPADLPSFLRGQGVNLAKYPAGGYEIEIADALERRFKGFGEERQPQYRADSRDGLNALLDKGRYALTRGDFVSAAAAFSSAIDEDGDCGEAWLGALMAELEVRSIKNEKKFAQEISNRLWSSGTTVAECNRRLAANEHILYALSSPYYKNAVKYSTAAMARTLSGAKSYIMDMADKCNAALKLSLNECASRESAASSAESGYNESYRGGYDDYDYDYDNTSNTASNAAAFAGGAIAGGLLGAFLGGRRRRRRPPVHMGFMPPPRPPRPAPPRGPRVRPFGGPRGPRFGGGPRMGGPRGRR